MSKLYIRKVAVLGAGVMGAQIAAHLANADVPVVLFDLPAPDAEKGGNPNGIVQKALDGLKKLKPPPFGHKDRMALVEAANYGQHLDKLADCDFVIEAIAEKFEWKEDLYRKIAPHLKPGAIIASNTSGLSINKLAQAMPEAHRPNFCGIHFFNPPRYMALVEIIPCVTSDAAMLDNLETWLTSRLGKGIIRALDTPNFIANRVGVAWLLMVAHHTARLGLCLRRGRCADRHPHRPAQVGDLSPARRGRPRHHGPRHQHHEERPGRRIPGMPISRCPTGRNR